MKKQIVFVLLMIFSIVSINAQTLYGGVEVGAKGVKATVLKVTQMAEGSRFDIVAARTINTTISQGISTNGLITDFAADESADAVKELYEWEKTFNVTPNHIYVVGSSGVAMATNHDILAVKVLKKVGVQMEFITADQEGKLVAKGAIPYKKHTTSLVLDIGGGNTKGGIFEETDDKPRFAPINMPLGSVTMTDLINKKNPTDFNDYVAKSLQVKQENLDPAIKTMFDRKPGAKYRQNLYFIGGAVWAFAILSNPTNTDPYFAFTYNDVLAYQHNIINNFDKLMNPDLSYITDPAVKAQAEKDIARVRDTYSRESLLAGSMILIGCNEAIGTSKQYYFVRQGHIGWLIAYIVDHSKTSN